MIVYFNNELAGKTAPTKPFGFQLSVDFNKIEESTIFTMTFDQHKVSRVLGIYERQLEIK